MKKFTKTHEWVLLEDNIAYVGISENAAEELGDVTFIELPEVGKEIKKGDVLCTLESVKSASDVYAPVSGKIVEVNTLLDNNPEIINDSPEKDGWIAKIEILNKEEVDKLLSAEEYKNSL
ncbi:glycine cleavage system protein GcvH [Marinitoga sp. 38H-ov]|uniref:glycine cleavage system protein GcvH n=1 Tax=Marinitoga sp. 38H-ov TaxID=1755814 RepID=UPI0013EDD999|nr:glycine cleavage system protein GcvH [Marinitoga sp. 38H-ov]KAF2955863.1 glycine cleavage system protein H [Marinitoga sp. 38H-ov]